MQLICTRISDTIRIYMHAHILPGLELHTHYSAKAIDYTSVDFNLSVGGDSSSNSTHICFSNEKLQPEPERLSLE